MECLQIEIPEKEMNSDESIGREDCDLGTLSSKRQTITKGTGNPKRDHRTDRRSPKGQTITNGADDLYSKSQ